MYTCTDNTNRGTWIWSIVSLHITLLPISRRVSSYQPNLPRLRTRVDHARVHFRSHVSLQGTGSGRPRTTTLHNIIVTPNRSTSSILRHGKHRPLTSQFTTYSTRHGYLLTAKDWENGDEHEQGESDCSKPRNEENGSGATKQKLWEAHLVSSERHSDFQWPIPGSVQVQVTYE